MQGKKRPSNSSQSLYQWSLLLSLWVGIFLSGYTWKGKGKKPREVGHPPYLSLARQALQSRDVEAARRVLAVAQQCWVKHKQSCGFSRQDYLMLTGVLLLESGDPQRAVAALQQAQTVLTNAKASKPSKDRATIQQKERMAHEESQRVASWFYLGQALFRVGRFREAAEALGKAESLGQGMTGFYRLWSRAWLRAGKAERARLILEKGLVRYPRDSGLLREVTLLYAEVGFFQAAIQTAQKITEADAAIGAQVWAVLLDRMRTKAGWSQHLKLLETLRLRFPRNDGILVRRCVAWATAQAHRTAATCFAQLAYKMPDMAYYAAAAYLQAGDLFQAMRWNQRIPSEKRRRQQHAALLLTQRAYAQAFALLWPLWKAGNLEDSERYRLAYAALQIGRYTDSEQLLRSLRGTSMKSMGSALETVVRQCRKTPWLCVAR